MNAFKNTAARDAIRAALEPIKNAVMTEVGKIQAEIRGSTEAVCEARREQAKVFQQLEILAGKIADIDARLRRLEEIGAATSSK